MNNLITDIQSRFTGTASEQVTIRCTDPNNVSSYDEKTFAVNYAPFNTSVQSNYEYSWFAKGNMPNWAQADNECSNLTEGGHNDWKLPLQSDYVNLSGSQLLTEGALWCGTFGTDCSDMPDGVLSIWLSSANASNAYILYGNNLATINTVIPKANGGSTYGVRCVR